MTKLCPKCSTVKDAADYHHSRSGKNGLDRCCKACTRDRKAALYQRDRERVLARNQAWKDRSKGPISVYNKAHYTSNRVKYQARKAVYTALASGRIVKADACNRCAVRTADLAGHHYSYAREHWLDVEWLCKQCHIRHHAQENAA